MVGYPGFAFSRKLFLLAALACAAGAASAQTVGDASRGLAVAESWCATCHIIDLKSTGRSVDAAPPFPKIAADSTRTTAYLQRWLTSSHPQMPNFNMGRREVEDLSAYLKTLTAPR